LGGEGFVDGAEQFFGPGGGLRRCRVSSIRLQVAHPHAGRVARIALSGWPALSKNVSVAPTPRASPILRAMGCWAEPFHCTQSKVQISHSCG
jgi:hypothetical protein